MSLPLFYLFVFSDIISESKQEMPDAACSFPPNLPDTTGTVRVINFSCSINC